MTRLRLAEPSVQAPVTVRVAAKVNLQLSVGAPDASGYHPVVSVYHAIGIYDEVVASAAEDGSGVSITVEGPGTDDVPLDATNLAWRAAVAVARLGGRAPDVHLHLRKGIPVAGGMAGGSADGAAALVACDVLWETGLERDTLLGLAADLGADVPFSLHGGTAVGTGRGEQLTPALARGQFHWVMAYADRGLSTAAVYAECDRLRGGTPVLEPRVSDAVMGALRAGDPVALGRSLTNDLQPAALSLRPALRQVLEVGLDRGALGAIVSGSGPSCAFLVRDDESSLDVAVALTASGVCPQVGRALGPVHGARVVG